MLLNKMKLVSIICLLLLPAMVAAAEDHATCACEAAELGFTINCANKGAMNAAVAALDTNNCDRNCSSALCKKNFFIMQAHHDYCLENELTEAVEDNFHSYEDVCERCEILRKVDPKLPDCPTPNCGNGSGNTAYNALKSGTCLSDCSSGSCKANFQTLKAVHDLCDEDTLSSDAELAFHEYSEACEDQSCNVLDTGDEADQLVCSDVDTRCPPGISFIPGVGCICFSGSASVEMPEGATVALKDLSLGDFVKTAGGSFEPVYGFAHYAPTAMANFLEIATTSKNFAPLQVSSKHMIRREDGRYVPAESVKVGDVLFQGHKVTDINVVQAMGIFAPYTPSGTIVVDGIEASCYVVPDMDIAGMRFTGQWLAHTFEFPHRVACHYLHSMFYSDALCNAYNEEGISLLKETPMKLYNQLMNMPFWMQSLALGIAVLVLIVFAVTEVLVFKHPLLFVALAHGAFYILRTSKKQS